MDTLEWCFQVLLVAQSCHRHILQMPMLDVGSYSTVKGVFWHSLAWWQSADCMHTYANATFCVALEFSELGRRFKGQGWLHLYFSHSLCNDLRAESEKREHKFQWPQWICLQPSEQRLARLRTVQAMKVSESIWMPGVQCCFPMSSVFLSLRG